MAAVPVAASDALGETSFAAVAVHTSTEDGSFSATWPVGFGTTPWFNEKKFHFSIT